MKKKNELTYKQLRHYYDTTIGLYCIDRNPNEVDIEWIHNNAFQLENISLKNAPCVSTKKNEIREVYTFLKDSKIIDMPYRTFCFLLNRAKRRQKRKAEREKREAIEKNLQLLQEILPLQHFVPLKTHEKDEVLEHWQSIVRLVRQLKE